MFPVLENVSKKCHCEARVSESVCTLGNYFFQADRAFQELIDTLMQEMWTMRQKTSKMMS